MEPVNPYQAPNTDVSPPAAEGTDQTGPFSPAGRFGRLSYIAWGLVIGVIGQVISMLAGGGNLTPDPATGFPQMSAAALTVTTIIGIVTLVIIFIFVIRRLHDFDAAGWWSLVLLVPLANFVLLLLLWFKRGTEGVNGYGPARMTPGWEKVVGYIGIALIVLGLIFTIFALLALPTLMTQMGAQS